MKAVRQVCTYDEPADGNSWGRDKQRATYCRSPETASALVFQEPFERAAVTVRFDPRSRPNGCFGCLQRCQHRGNASAPRGGYAKDVLPPSANNWSRSPTGSATTTTTIS